MPIINYFSKSLLLCGALLLNSAITQADEALVFEQVDPQAEQARLIEKFGLDKDRATAAIENTKAQILKSQAKPYLPELYLRLAELYIEKARLSYMQKRIQQGPGGSVLSTFEAENLKIEAVEIYQRILNVYPKFDQRDKVHFYLAHEYKELKKPDEMIAEYKLLVKNYPKSQYAPEAILLMADYSASQGKDRDAEQGYRRVLDYSQSSARRVARYKLAWIHINRKEFARAVTLLEESVGDYDNQKKVDVDTYDAIDIRLESLMDLAFVYPDHFKKSNAEHAVSYFEKLAWSRESYLQVLNKLGLRLSVKNEWSTALGVYRKLAKLQSDPIELVKISDALFEAYDKTRSIDIKQLKTSHQDVSTLIHAVRLYQASAHVDPEDKEKTLNRFEQYTRDLSTSLHQGAKNSSSIEQYRNASIAYQSYLSFFGDSKYADALNINLANTLYNSKQYFEAGKQFEKVSQIESLDKNQHEQYLYSATQAYFEALQQPDELNLYKTVQARAGLIDTGLAHIKEFPRSQYHNKISYNVAWTKYNEGKFNEAATMMHSFILENPNGSLTDAAIETLIDAYQVTENFVVLQRIAAELSKNSRLSSKNRNELARVASVAQSKIVSTMTASAIDDWDTGKDELLAYAEQHESSALGKQALLSLIATSQEQSDLKTLAISARNFITKYPSSEEAETTAKMLIDTQLKSAQFRSLTQSLASYSAINKAEGAAFKQQAVQMASRMGAYQQANQWASELISDKRTSMQVRADVAMLQARNSIAMGQTDEALQHLLTVRSAIRGDERLEIDAYAGLLFEHKGDSNNATKLYNNLIQATGGKASSNASANQAISDLGIRLNQRTFEQYQGIQLTNGIDANVVAQKSQLLEALSAQYQRIAGFQSPAQTAKAMVQLSAINQDFAQFLINAPIPTELSGAQKTEYQGLIADQAKPYKQEAQAFANAAQDIINKFELIDASINNYSPGRNLSLATAVQLTPAISQSKSIIGINDDKRLAKHEAVIALPSNVSHRLVLIDDYLNGGDFGQALLMAETALEQMSNLKAQEKATLANISGVALHQMGQHQQAVNAFNQALGFNSNHSAARANLSATLKYFNATNAAQKHQDKLDKADLKNYPKTHLISWAR